MRPTRFLFTVCTSLFAFILLIHLLPSSLPSAEDDYQESSRIRAYFNWRTPSSLFPPSAVISLTDDNSTFFLARPAAFGPLLPTKSLSGQLWVGSGFDFDGHGHVVGGFEGELGCSDVPGWTGNDVRSGSVKVAGARDKEKIQTSKKRRDMGKEEQDDEQETQRQDRLPHEHDGTDDHLHHPLPPSHGLNEGSTKNRKPTHADIQSLQESAEIAGKVVLLSRGGCGFLEKVKWVQRRGGVALIVGDDIRGGPLVTMYARGDTSNVTIPSLFTSHTTAHLLSSLIPSGNGLDDLDVEDATRLGLALTDNVRLHNKNNGNRVDHTGTAAAVRSTSSSKSRKDGKNASPLRDREGVFDEEEPVEEENGWFRSLFGGSNRDDRGSRPPSSGNLKWVRQIEFEDDLPPSGDTVAMSTATLRKDAETSTKRTGPTDGFQIGVQDWRDPDLVAEQREQIAQGASAKSSSSMSTSKGSESSNSASTDKLKGGSITPGSGEYGNRKTIFSHTSNEGRVGASNGQDRTSGKTKDSGSWFSNLFSSSEFEEHESVDPRSKKVGSDTLKDESFTSLQASYTDRHPSIADGAAEHEGLWVTLTPTSMSSSPFFDTLLVLVVSPLVTLTVVYALLLLRSRIRRRRWRAPKSVVERLPVRTYHTMPSSSPTTASTTSSVSTVSVTTPLLTNEVRQGARTITARSRPRSRTASEFQTAQASSSLLSSETNSMASPSLEQIEEKRAAGLAEWRRRYGGKQRECVVCLEEYVDGISRVMSLPCGHEFHEGCITPWLTTRRRTCPICKADIVRPLHRSAFTSGPSPLSSHISTNQDAPYGDEPAEELEEEEGRQQEAEQEVQEQAVLAHNDDPASQQPVSREDEAFEDLERGVMDRNR